MTLGPDLLEQASRYQVLMQLYRTQLPPDQALALVAALNGVLIDSTVAVNLDLELDDYRALGAEVPVPAGLVERLQALDPVRKMALCHQAELYWSMVDAGVPPEEALARAGLVEEAGTAPSGPGQPV